MDINYRSLEFWDTQEEFSVFEVICLWLDYVPKAKTDKNSYPKDWQRAHDVIVGFITSRELNAYRARRQDYHKWHKQLGDLPFDEPYYFNDDQWLDKAKRTQGVIRYWKWRVGNVLWNFWEQEERSNFNALPIWTTWIRREDIKGVADNSLTKPLFLYPEKREARRLKEIWPSESAEAPVDNKAEPEPIAPTVKAKPNKPKVKQKNTPKRKSKSRKLERTSPGSDTGKGQKNDLRKRIKRITKKMVEEKPYIKTPEIANSNDVKVALDEHKKRKWPDVQEKTIHDWIRAERRERGFSQSVGRPRKKKPSR